MKVHCHFEIAVSPKKGMADTIKKQKTRQTFHQKAEMRS